MSIDFFLEADPALIRRSECSLSLCFYREEGFVVEGTE